MDDIKMFFVFLRWLHHITVLQKYTQNMILPFRSQGTYLKEERFITDVIPAQNRNENKVTAYMCFGRRIKFQNKRMKGYLPLFLGSKNIFLGLA